MDFNKLIHLKKILLLVGCMIPLAGFLVSCSDGALAGAAKMDKAKIWLEKVQFKVSKDANNGNSTGNPPILGSAFYTDLVVAYDAEPLGKLAAMTADQYFADGTGKDQLKKDYADKIDFFEWTIIPGEIKEDEKIDLTKAYGLGGFVFAQYTTPDKHRHAIADQEVIMIHLDKKDFYISKVE